MSVESFDPNAPFRDTELGRSLLAELRERAARLTRPVRFMEVCGTHTVSLFRSGIRSLLPPEIEHVSGPGCPVCVTHDREIAVLIDLAGRPGVTVASFGDMLRVPGPDGRSLRHVQAEGGEVATVYSPLDALRLAEERPDRLIVFAAVGFETTIPTTAATVIAARERGVENFCLVCCHKLAPPAIRLLLPEDKEEQETRGINALLLPGHVATVLGLAPFAFLERRGLPAVVAGFEPADMLAALTLMLGDLLEGRPRLVNAYGRAVSEGGNARARELTARVFEPVDALWRGLGNVPEGGLRLRNAYAEFDALRRLGLELPETEPVSGCRCGDVLRGRIRPPQCPLFGSACTPAGPVGPCMVSSEGSCAAWHMYGGKCR